jgi:PAS domain S-box-containing protein
MAETEKLFEESEDFLKWVNRQKNNPDFYWKKCFDALNDPAFIVSANGVVLICNEKFETFVDLPAEKISGNSCFTLVHRTKTFIPGCPFVKSHNSGKREEYLVKISGRYYRMTIDPIFDNEGKFAGAVHIISDIHDLLKTNAERATMGKVIENSSDGIIVTDLKFRIKGWNHGAEHMFGYIKEEMLGKKIKELLQDSSEPDFDAIKENIGEKQNIERIDAKFRTKNGDLLDVSLGASPVYDEREILDGVAFILTDHTRQRKAEQNLLSFMAESILRFEKPLEMIKTNLKDILYLYEDGDINKEELNDLLSIQVSNAEKVLENIEELKAATEDLGESIPEIMRDFLRL